MRIKTLKLGRLARALVIREESGAFDVRQSKH